MATKRQAVFSSSFLEDLRHWIKVNPKLAIRLTKIVDAIVDDPFIGIAKPEPLRDKYSGFWSRRLNEEHRVIYRVVDDRVEFAKARDHY